MDLFIIILLIVLVGAIGALAIMVTRLRGEPAVMAARFANLDAQATSIAERQQEFTGRLAQISEQQAAERAELTRTLQERLDGVSKRLGEGLSQSTEKTALSLGQINKHLEVIDKAQSNIMELSGQIIGLQDILDNKQARGVFGEVQLENLVQSILPPSAYDFQVTLSNGKIVDCLVKLPNPPGPIGVDSKFPLESYQQLVTAKDDLARKQAEQKFRRSMLDHIKAIEEKYILPGETAESALLFLPSEAVYAELHARFIDVVEKSYRAKVWIVSPTTLMATLNTVRAILKDARMREQAGVIQKEVYALLQDVGRLDKRVDNLRKHFSQAEGDINEITISSQKISRRAEQIEDIQLAEAAPDSADEALAAPPENAAQSMPD